MRFVLSLRNFVFGLLAFALVGPSLRAQDYVFTTLAGSGRFGSADGVGGAARFHDPAGIAIDGAGNLYVSDAQNHLIRKVTPNGITTTVAGRAGVSGHENGPAATATFHSPASLAVDRDGNLFVADTNNHAIRLITASGVVRTFAGVQYTSGSSDGSIDARFRAPSGVAVADDGTVYVADTQNHIVRRITSSGIVSTLAGTAGVVGSADGTGAAASFNMPFGIAVDGEGNAYVADTNNHTIRKITPAGVVTTIAGLAGTSGSSDGVGGAARFSSPFNIKSSANGTLYVTDTGNGCVRKITPDLTVSTLARVGLFGARDATFDSSGNLYVADTGNQSIRKVTSAGDATVLAGPTSTSYFSMDGSGSGAAFNSPQGVVADRQGSVYVADANGNAIRKISATGVVTTLAGTLNGRGSRDGSGEQAQFWGPWGLAIDGAGNLYVTEFSNHTIRKVTPAGIVTTIAGSAGQKGSANGTGGAARFNQPQGIAVDAAGNLYVSDSGNGNHVIRKINPAGVVTTLAGELNPFGGYNDGDPRTARFNRPGSIAVDATGMVFVADTNNHVIRQIAADGTVSTYAGSTSAIGVVDGPRLSARFSLPSGLSIDSRGNLYVSDMGNATIRRISADGMVTTIGGPSSGLGIGQSNSGNQDGLGAIARFNGPTGVGADPYGNIYISDSQNSQIRKGVVDGATAPTITTSPQARNTGIGKSATFSILATGTPLPGYQWERQPAGAGSWTALQNDSAYAGVTTETLTITSATLAMHGDRFRCIVTNGVSPSAISAAATLTVSPPPVFTNAPQATFVAGQAGSFALAATSTPAATFFVRDGSLPPWAALNPVTGILSGTPPNATGSPFVFTVTAENGTDTASQAFILRVIATPAFTSAPTARQRVSYGQSLTLEVTTSGNPTFEWRHNGITIPGATGPSYTVGRATPADRGYYQVVLTNTAGTRTSDPVFVNVTCNPAQIIAWGSPTGGRLIIPAGLSDVAAVAAGENFNVALKGDGTITAWGINENRETTTPAGLANVVAIAAGYSHTLALKADGTVVAWGSNLYGECDVPTSVSGVVAIAAGANFSVALRANGTVAAWGRNDRGQISVPMTATGVTLVRAGGAHVLALKANGSVLAWGDASASQTLPPVNLGTVIDLAAGRLHSLALRSDGTMVAWGANTQGQISIPAGLANVVALAAADHSMALKADGAVVAWGDNSFGQRTVPSALGRVLGLAAGPGTSVAFADPSTYAAPIITAPPANRNASLGTTATFSVGVTSATGLVYQWRKDGVALANAGRVSGADSATLAIANVQSTDQGLYSVDVSNVGGSAVSAAATLTAVTPPLFTTQPASTSAAVGGSATFTAVAIGNRALSYQWFVNGAAVGGATASTLTISSVDVNHAGAYSVTVSDGVASVTSRPAVLGVVPPMKIAGTASEVGPDIRHPNGLVYDQVLLEGGSMVTKADPGQVLRVSFIDLSNDIVQVEFAGAGTLALRIENVTGPASPLNYNQNVNYVKGHATISISGADETTNLAIFSVGRMTALNQALFRSDVSYDGLADLASVSIASSNGKFGGLRAGNCSFVATKGIAGVYAPGVTFTGPIVIGDIAASDAATPTLMLGNGADVSIAGGDLFQPGARPIEVTGLARVRFTAGTNSHGTSLPARTNRARFEQNGTDVTALLVENP